MDLAALRIHRNVLISYLKDKVRLADWPGVSAAANDLRVLETQIACMEGSDDCL